MLLLKISETISTLHISWCNRPKLVLIWEDLSLELSPDFRRLGKINHEIVWVFEFWNVLIFLNWTLCSRKIGLISSRPNGFWTGNYSLDPNLPTENTLDFVFSDGSANWKNWQMVVTGGWWRVVGYECSMYFEPIFCSWENERKESAISTVVRDY